MPYLLEAAHFMDSNECQHVIQAARSTVGLNRAEILQQLGEAGKAFGAASREKFAKMGEW